MKCNIFILVVGCLLGACSVFKNSPKTAFKDGFYTQIIENKKNIVYVDVEEENLRIHPIQKNNRQKNIDSLGVCQIYPQTINKEEIVQASFKKSSLDIDFLTIPLKYRPSQLDVPVQLNTNLNGALYVGYRLDNYSVDYKPKILKTAERDITHYGFSMGIFSGFGSTFMSPTTTNNILNQEYDGVVWNKGIAGIIAIDRFTLGLALGTDHLLDKNKSIWIYQGKAWLGLVFGLNLN
jgi:hypothetical protein